MSKSSRLTALLEKLKENKKLKKVFLALLLVVILTVLFFSFITDKKSVKNSNNNVESYANLLESRLSETLSKVKGVGDVSVVITVESGMETVLAMKTTTIETSSGIEKVETPILVNGKTVVLKENYPKITGVLIVAKV